MLVYFKTFFSNNEAHNAATGNYYSGGNNLLHVLIRRPYVAELVNMLQNIAVHSKSILENKLTLFNAFALRQSAHTPGNLAKINYSDKRISLSLSWHRHGKPRRLLAAGWFLLCCGSINGTAFYVANVGLHYWLLCRERFFPSNVQVQSFKDGVSEEKGKHVYCEGLTFSRLSFLIGDCVKWLWTWHPMSFKMNSMDWIWSLVVQENTIIKEKQLCNWSICL